MREQNIVHCFATVLIRNITLQMYFSKKYASFSWYHGHFYFVFSFFKTNFIVQLLLNILTMLLLGWCVGFHSFQTDVGILYSNTWISSFSKTTWCSRNGCGVTIFLHNLVILVVFIWKKNGFSFLLLFFPYISFFLTSSFIISMSRIWLLQM